MNGHVRNRVQAVTYAAALEAGNARSELLRRAVASWAEEDIDAAMAWTRQMSAGNERDSVASSAADQIRRLDPAKASQWLDMIQAPDKREGFISDIAGEWDAWTGPPPCSG
jgi:hypothetical protein